MLRAERKKKKREEANARTAQRAERTDEQQLGKLDAEGWTATKERARLQQRIAATQKARDKTCEECGAPFRGTTNWMVCPRCSAPGQKGKKKERKKDSKRGHQTGHSVFDPNYIAKRKGNW
jgi:rubrerythrin